ncbi:type IX secretion system outer membrane channel protein PorV [Flavobacteriaceae bacterium]|nr:type IX secretion system outer membrane channel protein PorV [Flavobacteriaceae bacterium]MDA9878939.1 type IX secretion system outer membrane channel protein PorV [Flavobacteriaceae bacterium]MDB2327751.1 type IX secretion system outer membrane channel protein PorV [Flavobacteriaceae bacterium]
MLNPIKTYVLLCFSFVLFSVSGQNSNRVITTSVPFLLITPDARAAGMGELGVATAADAYSQQWNPAKYAFASSEKSIGISYTPYLSKLVDDIFLGNVTFYRKVNDRSAWATSLKYFSLGDIQFNEFIGGSIVDQGQERPSELTLDLSYSLKLSEQFSMAVAGRYIRSDLRIATDADTSSANTLGVDIAGFYQSKIFDLGAQNAIFRSGINISNVGPRLNYDVGGQKSFIPTNLKMGFGLDLFFDDQNSFGIYTEFNKLLVPTPVAVYDAEGLLLGYQQPDIDFVNGMITSFSDAPGGFSEELNEITAAIGLEYQFQDVFSLRTGYFNESKEKGSRRYLTLGAGFDLNFINIDISYLFSTSNVRNPLENTIRFSLSLDLESSIPQTEAEVVSQ